MKKWNISKQHAGILGALVIFACVGTYAWIASAAPTATLRLLPSSGALNVGDVFTVDLVLDTGGQAASIVQGNLTASNILQFMSADAATSLFPEEVDTLGTTNGVLSFTRARLDDGFNGGTGNVLRLTFKAITAGNATITINQGASDVRALSDSTNILNTVQNASFAITNSSQPPPPPVAGGGAGGAAASPPAISRRREVARGVASSMRSATDACLLAYKAGDVLPQLNGKLIMPIDGSAVIFRDVSSKDWFAFYVASGIQKKFFTGYNNAAGKPKGEYGPRNNVSLAEMLKIALNIARRGTNDAVKPRNPSGRQSWAAGYVRRAEDLQITVFLSLPEVNKAATRGEVVQTLLEAAGIKTGASKGVTAFKDVPANDPHADAIATAVTLGIVTGDLDASGKPIGTFRPNATVNRAEMAKMAIQLFLLTCKN